LFFIPFAFFHNDVPLVVLDLFATYTRKASGEFEVAGGKPNDLAAVQVTPGHWILAKIISFDSETGMYNLSDEDIESNKGA
jgi:hypothetical protein